MKSITNKKAPIISAVLLIVLLLGVCIVLAAFTEDKSISRLTLFATLLFGFSSLIISALMLLLTIDEYLKKKTERKNKNE